MHVCFSRWLVVALCGICMPLTAFFVHNAHAANATVSGDVVYRERMALPPTAMVWVTLYEHRLNGPATVVSETSFTAQGRSVPLPFVLTAPQKINPKATYTLTARIDLDGEALFGNAQPLTVAFPLTVNARHTLLLHRVIPNDLAQPATKITSSENANTTLMQARWKLVNLEGTPAQTFDNQQEPHLVFRSRPPEEQDEQDEKKEQKEQSKTQQNTQADKKQPSITGLLSGSDGCNRLLGSYTLSPSNGHEALGIAFGQMASTLMMCPQGDAQARHMAQTLAKANGFRFVEATSGDARSATLELLHNATPVAQFQQVAL